MTNSSLYSTNKLIDLSAANGWRLQAIEHGIIDPSWEWLLTAVVYHHDPLQRLQLSLARIERLMEEVWIAYFHQPAALLRELGIPDWMLDYIKLDKCVMPVPLRWDAICRETHWKIIEINTGFCLGGLNGFSVNQQREDFYARSGSDIAMAQLDDTFFFLAESLRPVVGDNAVIPVIETAGGYEKYGFYLHHFVMNMNKTRSGFYISGTVADFEIIEEQIFFKGHAVMHFIPMFNLYELSENQPDHRFFLHHLKEESLVSLLGFRELIFSNKAFIPWLVSYAAATRSAEEAQEIADLFPRSTVLSNGNVRSFFDGDFILKPAEGYGGNGIVCSWLCQRDDWINALQHVLSDGDLWLIQERIIGNVSYMQSVDASGNMKEGCSSVVHGFITLRGKFIGNLTRAAIGIQQPGIINAHQGAAFGLSGLNLNMSAKRIL
ncbi:hypothetical protein [Erwinia pyrifoliae]|uniref:hypothetical protein n=1 Tax=Erwinia pyrifoliae TaxID=79967 RepID=UPI00223AD12E|nr:hypothetical protein [Erwinia pyrifoliae]MCT2385316.1 hypothetical protein [Erwinia pyrifoliae]MCU8585459.1 hypothetical protein [Erwinia pyrifoliae]